ncbi:MAG: DUF1987 domain-containing protein [Candidatus Competibacteraceae bacterium]|uniref:SiaC family regulatory phosphoprotein domain-containing protein n=1 Tax=Candidatus Contendobacter odensis Run_B_J11 TaxID=1400861 RepID=A0A7U7GF82_9GAMM|nr:DUF1987 domain-containing protein [Candidatus Contendobacter odensis]MBK8537325.1 DUF1987 domain-containing protein [Candidatus Competibacteraceae bacterium]MBK8753664.1 DUF1987 domain-containing protein [Candidatus Competibacteraceae bacterium]CDH47068.1 hypothetical protein BN874_720012 [Candidatus Contendobacter odensis Run_B_J11]
MDNLIIEATRSSPAIQFDADRHYLSICGESYPENAAAFYAPVFAWLKAFLAGLNDPATAVQVNLEIRYLNSSSTKVMLNFLDLLEQAAQDGKQIRVHWFYDPDNEAVLECGQDFSEELQALTFKLVEKG